MIPPEDARGQATVLREAASESLIDVHRVVFKQMAIEFDRAAKAFGGYDEGDASIQPLALVLPGHRVVDNAGDPCDVVRVMDPKDTGAVAVQLLNDEGIVSWQEFAWRFSPVVVVRHG